MRRLVGVLLALFVLALGSLGLWETAFVRLGDLADPRASRSVEVPDGVGGTRRLGLGPDAAGWTPLDQVSPFVVPALLVAEDPCFLEHSGFDWLRLRRALEANRRAGRIVRGGSTLTSQLVKNLFLWRERSVVRKTLEAYLTWRAERTLGKARILELYLNLVEWGPGVYGIAEASAFHFRKPPEALTPEEAAWLVSLLPNPHLRALPAERDAMRARTERVLHDVVERLRGRPPICSEEDLLARRLASRLLVVYPPDGHETASSSTYVLGTAPPSVEVRVQGAPVVRSPAGHFAQAVRIRGGETRIRVETATRSIVRRVRHRARHVPADVVTGAAESFPAWAEVIEARAIVRDDPGLAEDPRTPLPRGTRVIVAGRSGEWIRIESGGWIRESALRPGEGAAPDTVSITGLRVGRSGDWAYVLVETDGRPPFELLPSGRELILRLHRAAGIPAGATGEHPWIQSVAARETGTGAIDVAVRLGEGELSGYDARWIDGGLRLAFRRLPEPASDDAPPLSGLAVVLDPGHGGATDPGARGPSGRREADATLAIARLLASELRSRGARVSLTREDDRAVTLPERLRAIRRAKPHVVLSLHYDAHADGRDPLRTQGVEVYWFHPHARRLARLLHADLAATLGRAPRGAQRRSLALTEPAMATSILVELGFLTNPFEFEWIENGEARSRLSRALADALGRWRQTAS